MNGGDLEIAVRVKGDASGLVGQLGNLAEAERKVGDSASTASRGAGQLAAASGQLGQAARASGGALDSQGRAAGELEAVLSRLENRYDQAGAPMRRYQGDLSDINRLLKAGAIDADHAALLQQRANAAFDAGGVGMRRAGGSAGQLRAAYQNLGYQVQDVTQQLALGVNPMIILAQQGGQVASAFALMGSGAEAAGGKVGGLAGRALGFASFLAGPWGAALSGAALIAATLGSQLLRVGDTAKKAEDATVDFANSQNAIGRFVDVLTGKLKTQNQVLLQNAVLKRQAAIDKANETIIAARGQIIGAVASESARRAVITGSRFVGERQPQAREFRFDADLERILAQPGGIRQIDAALGDLVKRRPELAKLRREISDLAAGAENVLEDRNVKKAEIGLLTGAGSVTQYDQATGAARELIGKAGRSGGRGGGGGDSGGSGLRGVEASAGDAARELKALEGDLSAIVGRFDPARASAEEFAATLATIQGLQDSGKLGFGQALDYSLKASSDFAAKSAEEERKKWDQFYKDRGINVDADFDAMVAEIDSQIFPAMEDAGRAGGEAFRASGVDAAQAISRIFGGKLGDVFGSAVGLFSGGASQQAGGHLGALSSLAGGGGTGQAEEFAKGMEEAIEPLKRAIGDLLDGLEGLFSGGGDFTKALGKIAGDAAIGQAAGAVFSKATGVKGSNVGGAVGGAAGAAGAAALGLPPELGQLVGGIVGSTIGGLLKKTKTGSATITSIGGEATTAGNSGSRKQAAAGLAGNVQDALKQISEQFGGGLGAFAVSIGVRDKDFRVDPSGKGATKVKKGAVDFGEDEAAALSFAILDAIKDGAVTGLSTAVQTALRSSKDLQDAIAEALKVDELETLLGGIGAALGKEFRESERLAAERVRIARQYGFDLVKIEELNAKERAKAFEGALGARIGSVKALLDNLKFGDLFEGSIADQRSALIVQVAKARADAEAGVEGAADLLASLGRKLIEISRDGFGTAGGEFSGDRASVSGAAEAVIKAENDRVKAAQDAALATNAKLDKGNALADEANNLLAETNTILRTLKAVGISGGSSIAGGLSETTLRSVNLK